MTCLPMNCTQSLTSTTIPRHIWPQAGAIEDLEVDDNSDPVAFSLSSLAIRRRLLCQDARQENNGALQRTRESVGL